MTGVLLPTAAPVSPEVVGFLTSLAVALHKQRAYPPSHPMRHSALTTAYRSLTAILEGCPALKVGVARSQLLVEEGVTDPAHFVIRDFAARLHRIQVGALVFRSGLTLAEFTTVTEYLVTEGSRSDRLGSTPGFEAEHAEVVPIAFDALTLRDGDEVGVQVDHLWQDLAQLVSGDDQGISVGEFASPAFVAMMLERLSATETRGAVAAAIERMGRLNLTLEGEARVEADLRLRDLLATLPPDALNLLLDIDVGRDGLVGIRPAVDWLPAAALIELVESAARANRKAMSTVLLRLLQKMSRQGRGGSGSRAVADRDVRQIVKGLLEDWTLSDPNSKSHARLLETLARYEQATTSEGAPSEEWLRVIQITIETNGVGDHVLEAVEQCVGEGETAALVELLQSVGDDPAAAVIWKPLLAPQQLRRMLHDRELDPATIGLVLARAGEPEVPVLTDRVVALESGPVRRLVVARLVAMGPAIFNGVIAQLDRGGTAERCRLLGILAELPTLPVGFDVRGYLSADDPVVRVEAYRLVLRDPAHRDDALHAALVDDDERVVEVAIAAGAERLPRQSLTRLLILLSNRKRTEDLRSRAIGILSQFDTPTVRDWLLANMTTRPSWYRRQRLVSKSPIVIAKLRVLATRWAGTPGADAVLRLALRSGDADLIAACNGAFAQ